MLRSDTFSGSTGPNGGALSNGSTANAQIARTVFRANSATGAGGASAGGGGGIRNVAPGTVILSVSIVRNNTPDNCSPANTIAGCAA